MPPLNSDLSPFPRDGDELGLIPSKLEHEEGSCIEERKFELNIRGNLQNLKNLDYSKVVWRNVVLFVLLHTYTVYGVYLMLFDCTWKTLAFTSSLFLIAGLGITMGVHRLWAHRSYKANLPLRIVLALCNSVSFQNDIYEWSRDHRVHHKFSETDADPHNAHRGFFFSHMGWLMYRKHPDVILKGKTIDLSDLEADPVVMFQRKHYVKSVLLLCFVMPTLVPWYFWGENMTTALFVCGFSRYTIGLHITWMVNSLAHWLGSKPYEKGISPSENAFVAAMALGEGWHNYHHVYPYDYRTGELGQHFNLNVTKNFIDMAAYIGWAWDLKTVNPEVVKNRCSRTGDGTHPTVNKLK